MLIPGIITEFVNGQNGEEHLKFLFIIGELFWNKGFKKIGKVDMVLFTAVRQNHLLGIKILTFGV